MPSITFVTGNDEKFTGARAVCAAAGVQLVRQPLDIDEVQSEDSEYIVRDKVQRAFDALQKPVVVSDDSWSVPGLNGFPGPYMKSVNQWFTAQNWLDLAASLKDRRIILIELLAYHDGRQTKLFRQEYTGAILTEPKGNYGSPIHKIVTMASDGGLSIAEVYDQNKQHGERQAASVWQTFAAWAHANLQ
jgi:inosine/xanthosine triphosphate pyrophosphatase family protein